MTFEEYSIEKTDKKDRAVIREISLEDGFYERDDDLRTPYDRDYTRIIHCFGFRRLKHKTQVFFHPYNDHVCTRIEHALHVASIASTICKKLGLNTELVNAIAIGHDLGHAPFGHHGEWVLDDLWRENIEGLARKIEGKDKSIQFWHEKNSLFMVDKIETVKDYGGFQQNLNLTYAVRDGIICHCGENEVKELIPRGTIQNIDLNTIEEPGTTNPYTWEGCVVRVSDIISYLGRDIEDAEMSDIVNKRMLDDLKNNINRSTTYNLKDISNGVIIHILIGDLCKTSSPENGLSFSDDGIKLLRQVKKFDYKSIYRDNKIKTYKKYINLVLVTIFDELSQYYETDIVKCLLRMRKKTEPVFQEFIRWLERYHEPFDGKYKDYISGFETRQKVKPVYLIKNKKDYMKAVIHYISGFTDNFAISCYNDVKSIV